MCHERVLVSGDGQDEWIAHPTRGEFKPCGTYPPVRTAGSGQTLTRTSDSGRKMTLRVDGSGNPIGRWRYSNGQEVPAYDRSLHPCPIACGNGATKTSVNMGKTLFMANTSKLVRYIDPAAAESEGVEQPQSAAKRFPWLLVIALAVGAFLLFRK